MGWLPKFKIAQKLPLALVGSALLVSAGVGIASYLIGSNTVDQMSIRQMQMVAGDRAEVVRDLPRDHPVGPREPGCGGERADDTARLRHRLGAVRDLEARRSIRSRRCAATTSTTTRMPPAQRQALDTPATAAGAKKWNYDFLHAKVHPNFRRQLEARGYSRPVPARSEGEPRLLGDEERRLRPQFRRGRRARGQRPRPGVPRRDGIHRAGQGGVRGSEPSTRWRACRRASLQRRSSIRATS